MKLFTHTDSYGYAYWDMLDGIKMIEGERLRVRWPDGHDEEIAVHVERIVKLHVYGQGENYDIMDERAYFSSSAHGAPVKVYVRDSLIYAERVAVT